MDMAAKGGRLSWALDLLEEMRRGLVEPDAFTYTTLIKAAGDANNVDIAIKLLQVNGAWNLSTCECGGKSKG